MNINLFLAKRIPVFLSVFHHLLFFFLYFSSGVQPDLWERAGALVMNLKTPFHKDSAPKDANKQSWITEERVSLDKNQRIILTKNILVLMNHVKVMTLFKKEQAQTGSDETPSASCCLFGQTHSERDRRVIGRFFSVLPTP